MSGPLRGTEVMKETRGSDRRSLSRETTRGAPFITREIGERKTGKDDAAEGGHSALGLSKISVRIEVRLVLKPIEGLTGLGESGHREL
jgi:hypothetical protein